MVEQTTETTIDWSSREIGDAAVESPREQST